jgi:hypothetical protein
MRQLEAGKVPGFSGNSPFEGANDASENKGS